MLVSSEGIGRCLSCGHAIVYAKVNCLLGTAGSEVQYYRMFAYASSLVNTYLPLCSTVVIFNLHAGVTS
jgi:hypothetical protein